VHVVPLSTLLPALQPVSVAPFTVGTVHFLSSRVLDVVGLVLVLVVLDVVGLVLVLVVLDVVGAVLVLLVVVEVLDVVVLIPSTGPLMFDTGTSRIVESISSFGLLFVSELFCLCVCVCVCARSV